MMISLSKREVVLASGVPHESKKCCAQLGDKTLEFDEHRILGDGNCGFTSLGTTREEVSSLLLSLADDEKARIELADEIQGLLRENRESKLHTEETQKLFAELDTAQAGVDEHVRKLNDQLATEAKTTFFVSFQRQNLEGLLERLKDSSHPPHQTTLTTLRTARLQIFQIREKIKLCCQSREVFERYIVEGLARTEWLGYRSAKLFAKFKDYNLYVFHPAKNRPGWLELAEQQECATPENTFYLLHTNGFTHYNLLSIAQTPTPKKEEDEKGEGKAKSLSDKSVFAISFPEFMPKEQVVKELDLHWHKHGMEEPPKEVFYQDLRSQQYQTLIPKSKTKETEDKATKDNSHRAAIANYSLLKATEEKIRTDCKHKHGENSDLGHLAFTTAVAMGDYFLRPKAIIEGLILTQPLYARAEFHYANALKGLVGEERLEAEKHCYVKISQTYAERSEWLTATVLLQCALSINNKMCAYHLQEDSCEEISWQTIEVESKMKDAGLSKESIKKNLTYLEDDREKLRQLIIANEDALLKELDVDPSKNNFSYREVNARHCRYLEKIRKEYHVVINEIARSEASVLINQGEFHSTFGSYIKWLRSGELSIILGNVTSESIHKKGLPISNTHDRRRQEITGIYQSIASQLKDFVVLLIDECIKTLGTPPCGYCFIVFGSHARQQATPYSDLEFGILIEDILKEENERHKSYFRRLTKLLSLKIVNLGETTPRIHHIESLAFLEDRQPLRKGFSIDGQSPAGCKTPLGKRDNKGQCIFELIATPKEMAAYSSRDWHEKEPLLFSTIYNSNILCGDKALYDTYRETINIVLSIKNKFGQFYRKERALSLLCEDIQRFSLIKIGERCNEKEYFFLKHNYYRFLVITLQDLAMFFAINLYKPSEIICALYVRQIIDKKLRDQLLEGCEIIDFLRLLNYCRLDEQDERVPHYGVIVVSGETTQEELMPQLIGLLINRYNIELFKLLVPYYEALKDFCRNYRENITNDFSDLVCNLLAEGLVFAASGEQKEAIKKYERAYIEQLIAITKNEGSIHNSAIILYNYLMPALRKQGKTTLGNEIEQEASDSGEITLPLQHLMMRVSIAVSVVLGEIEVANKILQDFSEGVKKNPTPISYRFLGYAQQELGQKELANDSFAKALSLRITLPMFTAEIDNKMEDATADGKNSASPDAKSTQHPPTKSLSLETKETKKSASGLSQFFAPASSQESKNTLPENHQEVDVPDDNNCLFWATSLAILLPTLNDESAFNTAYTRLFGTTGSLVLESKRTQETVNIDDAATKEAVRAMLRTYDCQKETPRQFQGDSLKKLVCDIFRNRVVDYMTQQLDEATQKSIYIEAGRPDWNSYTAAMRQPTGWGGEPEIRAISQLAQVHIKVSGSGYTRDYLSTGATTTLYIVHASADKGTEDSKNHYHFGLAETVYRAHKQSAVSSRFTHYNLLSIAQAPTPQQEEDKKEERKAKPLLDKSVFIISFAELEQVAEHLEDKTTLRAILAAIQQTMAGIAQFFPIQNKSLYYPEIRRLLETIDQQVEKIPAKPGFHHSIRDAIQKAIAPLQKEVRNFLLQEEGVTDDQLLAKTQALYAQQSLIRRNETIHKDLCNTLNAIMQGLPKAQVGLRCFISYAWPLSGNQHKEYWLQPFLRELHQHLSQAGIKPLLDIIDNKAGANIVTFTQHIEKSEFALLLCTESLWGKHHDPQFKVVQTELSLLRQKYDMDIASGQVRVFPLLVSGSRGSALLPEHHLYRTVRDWRNQSYLKNLEQLIGWICYPDGVSKEYQKIWQDFYAVYPALADPMTEKQVAEELALYWHKREMEKLQKEVFYQGLQSQQYQTLIPKSETKEKTDDKAAKDNSQRTTVTSYTLPKAIDIFVGREDLLSQLAQHFGAEAKETKRSQMTPPRKLVLCTGLGGVGKTQLALRYAHDAKKQYKQCFWFLANSKEILVTSYRQLAKEKRLIGDEYVSDYEVIKAIQQWFGSQSDWLIIYDNVEQYADLESFLPTQGNGDILITSRLAPKKWPKSVLPIFVDVLTPEEANQLVSSLIHDAEDKDVPKLTKLLGYLPLALVQASAYIREQEIPVARYLEVYEKQAKYLLSQSDMPPGLSAHDPVLTTWNINLEAIAVEEKAKGKKAQAKQLLQACAYLNPQKIPYALLKQWYQFTYPALEEPFEESLGRLHAYSLVQTDEKNQVLNVHCLVQEVTCQSSLAAALLNKTKPSEAKEAKHSDSLKATVLERLLQTLANSLRAEFERETQVLADEARQKALLPHAQVVARWMEQTPALSASREFADLLWRIGNVLWMPVSDLPAAKSHYERALAIQEAQDGPHHWMVAIILGSLSNVYQALGDAGTQKALLERGLAIQEAHYGRDHWQVASTLTNLAIAIGDLGDTKTKKTLLERTLKIEESHYGRDHWQVAITLTNLAIAIGDLGDAKTKKTLLERTLTIKEAHYGRDHWRVAITLGNLANVFGVLGDEKTKKSLLERALMIEESHYGRDHWQVASTLVNLANAIGDLGDAKTQKTLLERVLTIHETHYGCDHWQVAITLGNLANAFGALGDAKTQKTLLERALTIEESHYGRDHRQIAITIFNLAVACQQLEDISQALNYAEYAHRIFVASYENPDHPYIQKATTLLQELHLLQFQHPSPKSEAKGDSKAIPSVTASHSSAAFFAETAASSDVSASAASGTMAPAKKKMGPCSRIGKCTIS